ncbi:hypothetical protein B0H17DRAFT_1335346 [Mycena rosella]|uniref:Uncharacterized protein n=1 Tax=Mycena rosella TaxID=1033263 RepID=A0AAD7G6U6_MYCRO|nr:hypothetical protein B0H17DRAFT_1335346 [Mycena rosella]
MRKFLAGARMVSACPPHAHARQPYVTARSSKATARQIPPAPLTPPLQLVSDAIGRRTRQLTRLTAHLCDAFSCLISCAAAAAAAACLRRGPRASRRRSKRAGRSGIALLCAWSHPSRRAGARLRLISVVACVRTSACLGARSRHRAPTRRGPAHTSAPTQRDARFALLGAGLLQSHPSGALPLAQCVRHCASESGPAVVSQRMSTHRRSAAYVPRLFCPHPRTAGQARRSLDASMSETVEDRGRARSPVDDVLRLRLVCLLAFSSSFLSAVANTQSAILSVPTLSVRSTVSFPSSSFLSSPLLSSSRWSIGRNLLDISGTVASSPAADPDCCQLRTRRGIKSPVPVHTSAEPVDSSCAAAAALRPRRRTSCRPSDPCVPAFHRPIEYEHDLSLSYRLVCSDIRSGIWMQRPWRGRWGRRQTRIYRAEERVPQNHVIRCEESQLSAPRLPPSSHRRRTALDGCEGVRKSTSLAWCRCLAEEWTSATAPTPPPTRDRGEDGSPTRHCVPSSLHRPAGALTPSSSLQRPARLFRTTAVLDLGRGRGRGRGRGARFWMRCDSKEEVWSTFYARALALALTRFCLPAELTLGTTQPEERYLHRQDHDRIGCSRRPALEGDALGNVVSQVAVSDLRCLSSILSERAWLHAVALHPLNAAVDIGVHIHQSCPLTTSPSRIARATNDARHELTPPLPIEDGRSADFTAHRDPSCLRLRRSLSKVACPHRARGALCIIVIDLCFARCRSV